MFLFLLLNLVTNKNFLAIIRLVKTFFYYLFYPFILIYKIFYKQRLKNFFKGITIQKIDTLTGEQFEKIVELIFKYNGYQTRLTPASSDFGADVIATKKRITWVVQAKLYYNHAVGSKSVQEVTSALNYYKAHFACVITNWKYSQQAKILAKTQNVLLIDRNDIIEFLNHVKNKTGKNIFTNLKKLIKINVINL